MGAGGKEVVVWREGWGRLGRKDSGGKEQDGRGGRREGRKEFRDGGKQDRRLNQ